ncbi:porin family protein [Myroides injenensis]|uniref:porin family protein n=1 Tax=Myroides injenensis TaxID=1183151 RepID=UPI00226EAAB3|nr:porin family protein [Myroides injenensis]
MKLKYIITCLSLLFFYNITGAQTINEQDNNSFHSFFKQRLSYQVKAQFSIGGASPLGLPSEIRSVDSYNPTLQMGLEANATKWISEDEKFGIRLGIRFEGRGMKTKATVKNYLIEVNTDKGPSRGYFTGKVQTTVKNTYITFPISAVYNISNRWNLYGGIYFSGLIDKGFDGYVSNGYLRENSPTGLKVIFEEDASADYDYSDDLNRFQWGFQAGGEWTLNQHFKLFADLNYGVNQVFKSDFDAISFSMHNIYLNLGFGYQF